MSADECRRVILAAEADYDDVLASIRRRGGAFEAHPELVYYHADAIRAARERDLAIEAAELAYYSRLEV